MKSYALSLSVLAASLLAGCSTTPQQESTADNSSPSVQEFLLHGQVAKNEQGYTFSPCASSDELPLILTDDSAQNKIDRVIEKTQEKGNGENGYAASLYAYIEQPQIADPSDETFVPGEEQLHFVSTKVNEVTSAPKMTCQQVSEPQTDADETFVGQYQGQAAAASSPGVTTTLALNPDHSATAVYDYQNDDPSIVETGYWQAYSDGRVNLVMTKHNDRSLISVRTFNLDNGTLTTNQESINGQVYSLGSEGMSLTRIERDQTQEQAADYGLETDTEAATGADAETDVVE
ncbi:MAG: copper resistance protein NlpE N-terminal domain-containing protein [Vibrio sp.]